MTTTLRLYQEQAIADLRARFVAGDRKVVLSLPTGAGKTRVAAEITRLSNEQGNRVVFVCDRLTLVEQSARVFRDLGFDVGVVQANNTDNVGAPVVVASAQSLRTRHGEAALDPGLVIVDECHITHKATRAWVDEVGCPVIGLTATPFGAMSPFWDSVVCGKTTNELIADGVLVDIRAHVCTRIDLAGLRIQNGENVASEVEDRAIPVTGDIVNDWVGRCRTEGRTLKTIVFSSTVAHGEMLCDRFLEAGYDFRQISYRDTDREDREAKIGALRTGSIDGLISVDALSRGFDVVDIDCIVVARPIRRSLSTHIQMLGRGMRSAEGKTECILHDHCENFLRLMVATERFWEAGKHELDEERENPGSVRPDSSRECSQCGTINSIAALTCAECGAELREVKLIGMSGGKLQEVSKAARLRAAKAIRDNWMDGLTHDQQHAYVAGVVAYTLAVSLHPDSRLRMSIAEHMPLARRVKGCTYGVTGQWPQFGRTTSTALAELAVLRDTDPNFEDRIRGAKRAVNANSKAYLADRRQAVAVAA